MIGKNPIDKENRLGPFGGLGFDEIASPVQPWVTKDCRSGLIREAHFFCPVFPPVPAVRRKSWTWDSFAFIGML